MRQTAIADGPQILATENTNELPLPTFRGMWCEWFVFLLLHSSVVNNQSLRRGSLSQGLASCTTI